MYLKVSYILYKVATTMKINKTFINHLNNAPIDILKTLTVDEIVALIQKANHEYYNKGKPLFNDQIFDLIKEYLTDINPLHPVLKNVGATVAQSGKVTLPFYMGSLDKIKNDEIVLLNWKHKFAGDYVVSDKLDGNSALLVFDNGSFSLYSRGDGLKGQNISHLLPFLKHRLNMDAFKKHGTYIAIRGEIIISKKDFASIADKGANARNTVAGLINAKIPDLYVASLAVFVSYEVVFPALSPHEQMKYMKDLLGAQTVYNTLLNSKDFTMDTLSNVLDKRRLESPYEIDGIVVTHNAIYKRLDENPGHSFAFKSILTMEKAEVTVTKVEWNMSKDGIFVPVVQFTPVSLDGVTITRAHGFNGKYIRDNGIAPGATIVIMRSGAVIPYIVETLVKAQTPQMPDTDYIWSASGVDVMLDKNTDNEKSTDALRMQNVIYFFEKIDVHGLSSGIVARLYQHGYKTVGQILDVTKEELMTVEGFKETLANKIHATIASRKKNLEAYAVMDASNVLGRGIGFRKIKLICDTYPAILQSRHIPTITELTSIKGIEVKTANTFISNLPALFHFVDSNKITLSASNEHTSTGVSPSAVLRVVGKSFVFSGVRDKALESFITGNGGTVASTVSSKTSIVIVKDTDAESSKVTKAKLLKIPIMLLVDFKNELGFVS